MTIRLPAAERRRQLLDAALEVFAEHGFHMTSMNDVADAAGVTKPVLYQHFDSKRDLFVELLADVVERIQRAIFGAAATAPGPRAQVEAGFAAYIGFAAAQPSAFRLLFGGGLRRDGEFSDAIRQFEERMADGVAALIDADLDDEHRRLLGAALVGMAEGASRHLAGTCPVDDVEVMARRLSDLAWAGLRGVHPVPERAPAAGAPAARTAPARAPAGVPHPVVAEEAAGG